MDIDIMKINESEMRRLAFIQYLHHSATDQAAGPQPMASSAVLTFHDAVEHFLYLSAEHLDVSKPTNIRFMQYWERIKQKLPDNEVLSGKASMQRLNDARNNLKHSGIFANESDIKSFSASVDNFFYANTPKVFDIEYSEISLVRLVPYDSTQELLEEAEELLERGMRKKALSNTATAYRKILVEFNNKARAGMNDSPLDFGTSMRFQGSFHMNIDNSDLKNLLIRFVNTLNHLRKT